MEHPPVEASFCVRWKAVLPERESSMFSFQNVQYYFKLRYTLEREFELLLCRADNRNLPCKTFRVATHLGEDNNKRASDVLGVKDVSLLPLIIWKFNMSTVQNYAKRYTAVEGFYQYRVTFVFFFIYVAQSDNESDSESDNESDNVSASVSTTPLTRLQPTVADKCIQASYEIPPDMDGLSKDFSSLLEKKILTDVKLKCGGTVSSVHRSVLAARSEVFAAMFENKMVESETGTVDVTDLDAPVLDQLLHYVYSGKILDLSEDSAASLYEAGDKYAMHSLKMACCDWMIRNLTEDNCTGFLNIADAHSDLDFKAVVISFICDHPLVFKSTDWSTFSKEHPMLANEALQSYVVSVIK